MNKISKALSIARKKRKKFADGGSAFDWSGVGEAMPEHIGRDSPNPVRDMAVDTATMGPVRRYVKSTVDAARYHPGTEESNEALQDVGRTTGELGLSMIGPKGSPGTAGVFVGPYGAHMLRAENRAAAVPHPAAAPAIAEKAAGIRPEFKDIVKGTMQDLRDARARQQLETRPDYKSDRDIFQESGWSRGAEGLPRKEIPDIGAKLVETEGGYRLEHPAGDFHKIYDIPPIVYDPNLKKMGAKASYDPKTNQISLGMKPTDKGAVSAALHEVQHAIQRNEGFATGSNPLMEKVGRKFPAYSEYFPDHVPSWQKEAIEKENANTLSRLINGEATNKPNSADRAAFLSYQRSAGEAEARNVQARRAKSFRYQSHPADTEDVTRGLQHTVNWEDYYKAKGGSVGGFDPERASAYGLQRQGMIKSDIPGRTDKINMNVPSGSYIIPADIPSAIGEGNSMAGSSILNKMFNSGPYGMNLPRAQKGMARIGTRKSSLSKMRKFAEGGATEPTPIVAAGGEYVIHPETVMALGGGDMDVGHNILDAFVKQVRSKHISTLKSLKPPKGSK